MKSPSYAAAGVDIGAKAAALDRAKSAIRSTFNGQVLGDIGGFGGLFRPDFSAYRVPVLVASTDGVGTKLKVAVAAGRHDTCGADLVNHCVNDILVQGASPLFFLDYIATGKIDPRVLQEIIEGLAAGCLDNGTVLLGGETAEMPGFYAAGEYDVAGTIVGVVERERIVDGSRVVPGDVLVGLPSTGLHTNGYSLARSILFEKLGLRADSRVPDAGDGTIGDLLLQPHRSYLRTLTPLLEAGLVKAMAHITGGGFYDNIPRVLPEGVGARLRFGSWPVPPLFEFLAERGDVSRTEMLHVFNMGIGMVLIVGSGDLPGVKRILASRGESFFEIGEAVSGSRDVRVQFAGA
ncbi:MAG TPA: phosphoribosylformylglycinamidine cyclo-ligase [Thermoanaerobaculia bacterium]|nr:phosphoribosylformylglycinamidine cyclo-ligase [Thermoanaerobaculia bacterium]